jgi:branched-chain amino acid transport system permease protein
LLELFIEILINGASLAGIYFLISFAVTFVYGVGGFPNLAIGPIGLTGTYVTFALLRASVNAFIAILGGLAVSFFLGIIIQRFIVDPLYNAVGGGERGRIFVIYGTFGLCLLFPAILLNLFKTTTLTVHLPSLGMINIMNITITGYRLLSIVITFLTLIIAHILLNWTKGGTHVRAVTQNFALSKIIGINVSKIYLITAAVGGSCAYVGATMWGQIFSLELGSGMMFTLYGFIVAVMGGLGSVYGAVVVSFILGIALSATSFLVGGVYEHLITMLILILLLVIKPRGIIPTRREV